MQKLSLRGMSWVLLLSLALAGCSGGLIHPSSIPGVVQRADSISEEQARDFLSDYYRGPDAARHLEARFSVEADGIRRYLRLSAEQGFSIKATSPTPNRDPQPSPHTGGRHVEVTITDEPVRYIPRELYRFAEIDGIDGAHTLTFTDKGSKSTIVAVHLSSGDYFYVVVNGTRNGEQFKALLAALYKLCPNFR